MRSRHRRRPHRAGLGHGVRARGLARAAARPRFRAAGCGARRSSRRASTSRRDRARHRSRGGTGAYRRVPALADALAGVDWVQENLPGDRGRQAHVFAALDRPPRPEAVLASSTSAIPASQFTEALRGRARCLVAHPVNPPHLVPVVELCGAPWTSPAVDRARATRLCRAGAGAGRRAARDRRLHPQPTARRAAGRSDAARAARVTCRPRISTRRCATASVCAGRSWGRSRRSS